MLNIKIISSIKENFKHGFEWDNDHHLMLTYKL